jgi:hypothetical protein
MEDFKENFASSRQTRQDRSNYRGQKTYRADHSSWASRLSIWELLLNDAEEKDIHEPVGTLDTWTERYWPRWQED